MKGNTILLLELYLKLEKGENLKIHFKDGGNMTLEPPVKLQMDARDIYYATKKIGNGHKVNIFNAEDIIFIEINYKGDSKLWSSQSKSDQ